MVEADRDPGALRRGAGRVGRGLVVAAIHVYQGVSSVTPGACRFEPSCSHYALEAVRVHGPAAGGWLTLRRILRCRPGGDWGYDPVPDAPARRTGTDATNADRQHGRPSHALGAARGGSPRNG